MNDRNRAALELCRAPVLCVSCAGCTAPEIPQAQRSGNTLPESGARLHRRSLGFVAKAYISVKKPRDSSAITDVVEFVEKHKDDKTARLSCPASETFHGRRRQRLLAARVRRRPQPGAVPLSIQTDALPSPPNSPGPASSWPRGERRVPATGSWTRPGESVLTTPAWFMWPTGAMTGFRSSLPLGNLRATRQGRLWNEFVARYHYLGYKTLVGAQMRYAVHDKNGWPLAMLGFSTTAWTLAPRDRFIARKICRSFLGSASHAFSGTCPVPPALAGEPNGDGGVRRTVLSWN